MTIRPPHAHACGVEHDRLASEPPSRARPDRRNSQRASQPRRPALFHVKHAPCVRFPPTMLRPATQACGGPPGRAAASHYGVSGPETNAAARGVPPHAPRTVTTAPFGAAERELRFHLHTGRSRSASVSVPPRRRTARPHDSVKPPRPAIEEPVHSESNRPPRHPPTPAEAAPPQNQHHSHFFVYATAMPQYSMSRRDEQVIVARASGSCYHTSDGAIGSRGGRPRGTTAGPLARRPVTMHLATDAPSPWPEQREQKGNPYRHGAGPVR